MELKRVKKTERSGPFYVLTNQNIIEDDEDDDRYKENKQLLMIEACLRVSYTSPKNMYWITKGLSTIYKNGKISLKELKKVYIEWINQKICKEYLESDDIDKQGTNTPHIVLNYLDYILWLEDNESKKEFSDFKFEYRNSVEHWYPQHILDKDKQMTIEEGLNCLGNLCLVQREINSKFSNLPPTGKKASYEKNINNGSIKLRIMAKEINTSGNSDVENESANYMWKTKICQKHKKEMLQLLEKHCKGRI